MPVSVKKSPYHHGNLRQALIEAALLLLARDGDAGLSLRAVAREAGVSAPATYGHFENKDALLAVIAGVGFEKLSLAMADSAGISQGVECVRRLAVGYLRFALGHDALFRLMFAAPGKRLLADPTLNRQANASLLLLESAVTQFAPDVEAATLAAWALVHGLAEFILDERIARPDDIESFVNRVMSNLFSD